MLSPTLGHTTPRLGYLSAEAGFPEMFDRLQRYVAFTPLHNASGAPAISVPAGLTQEGLPIGVHLSARSARIARCSSSPTSSRLRALRADPGLTPPGG